MLNHEEIKKNLKRIAKIKPFINKYNWEGMHFPSEKDDWKTFEKNNVTTASNILYCEKYILLMFQTKLKLLKTNYLLMIPNGKVWHYLAVKELLPLLK